MRKQTAPILWQPLPDVRKSHTSSSACVIFANTSAHAQKLILRMERRVLYFSVRLDFEEALTEAFATLKLGDLELKREQKAALNAVASRTIARFAEFILETENRLGREARLQTENSSDINPVKDEFPVSNLSVYFSVQFDGKIGRKIRLRRKTLLN